MKIYVVSRTDEVDWDEYYGFVVAAENEDQALKFAKEETDIGEFKVEQIILEEVKAGIILSDFNAG